MTTLVHENQQLFVYGTLMKGERLHQVLESSQLVGEARISGRLYDLGAFPCAVNGPVGYVFGEVYLVSGHTLRLTDGIEGHPYHYQRKATTAYFDNGEQWPAVWAYFYQAAPGYAPEILSGSWRSRIEVEETYL